MTHLTADSAEAAFYAAFADCDLQSMAQVWSREEAICIHPGAVPLVGYEAVMRSWGHILTDAASPSLLFNVLRRITSGELAVHIVEERIAPPDDPSGTAIVLATNVYRRGLSEWLMVSHQGVLMSTGDVPPKPTLQ